MSDERKMSYDRKIFYTTAKIINHTLSGTEKHSTGFLFNYEMTDGKIVRTILTCKHSIKDFASIDILFCTDNGNSEPIDEQKFTMRFNSDSMPFIVKHPKEDVDLVALIFSYDKKIFLAGTRQPFFLSLDKSLIPSIEQQNMLHFIEDVIMVGYPQSIWDEYNNKPIIRKGITASPIQLDFNGKKHFLVDIASYHGSSGSPVYIFNSSSYSSKNGLIIGSRIHLLGMFFGGWEEVTKGTTPIKVSESGKEDQYKLNLLLPNNIGFVLKASVFMELRDIIEKRIHEDFFHPSSFDNHSN